MATVLKGGEKSKKDVEPLTKGQQEAVRKKSHISRR